MEPAPIGTGALMRILQVLDTSFPEFVGGSERHAARLVDEFVARGHRVDVIARRRDAIRPQQPSARTGSISYAPLSRRLLVPQVAVGTALAARRLRYRPDIVHLNHSASAIGANLAPKTRDVPSVYSFQGPHAAEYALAGSAKGGSGPALIGRVLRGIEGYSLRRAAAIVVLSRYMGEVLLDTHGQSLRARVAVIPPGVDSDAFRPVADRASLREQRGLPRDRPVLLCIRRLTFRMGIDLLIRALADPRVARFRPILLIGGTGPAGAELATLVERLDLAGSVQFLGFIPDPELVARYCSADLFVLPSRDLEGFGLVTLESLACGTPVVALPTGASPEVLCELDASLVAASPSAADLAGAIARFLEQGWRSEALRARCRDFVRDRYTWHRAGQQMIELFERVTAAAPAGSR